MSLVVSDVDGTLLGHDGALETFADWFECERGRVRLAYASGRFAPSVLESVAATRLPKPDAIIGGVGTEIYDVGRNSVMSEWPPLCLKWSPAVIQAVVEEFPELSPQPAEFNSHKKLSYFGYDLDEECLERLKMKLAAHGQRVEIVYSSSRDLDLLPAGVSKGAAAAFLAQKWGVDPGRVVVAGDTGNDASMFLAGFRGVVVANARDELRAVWAPLKYNATGSHAAGVLEGVRHWLDNADVTPSDSSANRGLAPRG